MLTEVFFTGGKIGELLINGSFLLKQALSYFTILPVFKDRYYCLHCRIDYLLITHVYRRLNYSFMVHYGFFNTMLKYLLSSAQLNKLPVM